MVLLGSIVEGETVLLLSAYAAHQGYLNLPDVIGVAFVGSLAGDQFWYFLGRRRGPGLLARWPAWRPRVEAAGRVFSRHSTLLVIGFRFFYGFRNVTPFAIGIAGMPPARFSPLNAAGAFLWASLVSAAGYLVGSAIDALVADARRLEMAVSGLILAAGAGLWLLHRIRRRSRARGSGSDHE